MKKSTLLFTIAALLSFNYSQAQTQLPNAGFEEWENEGTAEMEPKHWSSIKTADALAALAPEVLNRDLGRNSNYCVVLEVKSAFGIPANGIMTNGRVHADMNPANGYVYTDVNDDQWNTPFNDRPDSIAAWFKYAPKNDDRGKVEVLLHTGDEGQLPTNPTTVANTVATARYDIEGETNDWTRFSVPFEYLSSDNPDYILMVVTSGDSTIAKAGSKLWIDDIQLIYNTEDEDEDEDISVNEWENSSKHFSTYYDNAWIHIRLDDAIQAKSYQILDINGRVIQNGNFKNSIPFNHAKGIYILQVLTDKGMLSKKIATY